MLEPLGLGADDERLYLRLLARSATESELAASLPRLRMLRELGLVVEAPPGTWSAIAPDLAIELLARQREAELRRARATAARLMETYRRVDQADGPVEVLTDADAVRDRLERLVNGATSTVCGFDKAPYVHDGLEPSLELAALRRKVSIRALYEPAGLDPPERLAHLNLLVSAGEQARVAPRLPFKLLIVDRRWALIPACPGRETDTALAVRSSALLDALQTTFDTYWQRAVPVSAAAANATDSDARLLSMLAAGLTDEAIARHLGIGLRTVQRRVGALMQRLGARTRFQAGLQAARHRLL